MTRTRSIQRVAALYAVAIAVATIWLVWGPATASLVVDALIADLLATLVVFAGSRRWGNSSCYDAYWSVAPPLLGLWWWIQRDPDADPMRAALVAVVVVAWSVRLTGNWLRGWPGLDHEDWRYPLLRERSPRHELLIDLGAIHVVPTLQVFLACLPIYVVTRSPREVGWLDAMALVVGLGAVLLEHVADAQLRRFTRTARPGDVLDTGLWGRSRHPNYLGELLFWISLALFGIAASPADWWWVALGAVAIGALLLGASIPMMEQRSLARRPAYADVVARVPRLVPRLVPPRGPSRRPGDRAGSA